MPPSDILAEKDLDTLTRRLARLSELRDGASYDDVHPLAAGFLALDKHLRAGGRLPARWADRLPRCRGLFDAGACATRCTDYAGHPGKCRAKER